MNHVSRVSSINTPSARQHIQSIRYQYIKIVSSDSEYTLPTNLGILYLHIRSILYHHINYILDTDAFLHKDTLHCNGITVWDYPGVWD